MIIIGIFDGLGNQMFHYAFYKVLKNKKRNVKLDIVSTWNKYRLDHNGYELNRIFKINTDIATVEERNRFLKNFFIGKPLKRRNIISRIELKLLREKNLVYMWKEAKETITYNENYFRKNNIYFFSHYQTEKYFKNIEEDLKKEYTFPLITDDKNKQILDKMKNTNSISVHVRRGDYITSKSFKEICSLNYYKNAIKTIYRNVNKPYFFIFSNDIDWCRKNFDMENVIFVDNNKGNKSYIDMQLMSCCKHNIIANSTFSWWGAWLNDNKDKMVLSPNRWFNSVEGTCDIIPNDWYKINIL